MESEWETSSVSQEFDCLLMPVNYIYGTWVDDGMRWNADIYMRKEGINRCRLIDNVIIHVTIITSGSRSIFHPNQ